MDVNGGAGPEEEGGELNPSLLFNLIEMEDRWTSLVQNAPDIIILTDSQERIIYANHLPSGADPASILGKNLVESYVEPEYQDVVRAALAKVFSTGEPAGYESIASVSATGEMGWYSAKIAPIKKEGRTVAALLIVRDVTALKNTRDELERFFNMAPELLCIASPTGYFKKVNPAFTKVLGYSREELLSRPFWEFIHPDDREPTRAEVEKQLAGGATLGFVNRYVTADGDHRRLAWKALQDPQTGFLYATAEDITEKKRVEAELGAMKAGLERMVAERTAALVEANKALLAEQEARVKSEKGAKIGVARYRALMDTIMDGYLLLDQEGMILDVNEPYLKMTGYSRDDLVGRNLSLINPALKPVEIPGYLKRLRERGSIRFETRHRKKDGKTVDVEISASHEPVEGGFVVETVRDMTDRRMMQHAQRLEALSHLAGGMAHEFNNVLQGIMGAASLLEVRLAKEAGHLDIVEQILAAARRGADVVRRMLTFSRKSEHERKRLRISDVHFEVVKITGSSLPATIRLRHGCATGDESILADRTQLVQVLINLLINGAHAMNDSGGLTLNAVLCHPGMADPHGDQEAGCRHCPFSDRGAQRVCMAVGDTGHGIDPSIKERIFEPFFTTKEEGKGVGLGLAVAQGIVRENGGHMLFRSEVGHGTVFYVSFPSLPHAEAVAERAEPVFAGNGERILFVDDEKIITSMAKIYLESAGYEVEVFNDHGEAVRAFQAAPERYRIVVTDQAMRGATGMEVATSIKAVSPAIPIIMITGYQGKLPGALPKDAGINRILFKPISPRDLAVTIRQELDRGAS